MKELMHIDKTDVREENTEKHRKEMPRLQIPANLRNDVRERYVEEGSTRERESFGVEGLTEFSSPLHQENHQQSGNRCRA